MTVTQPITNIQHIPTTHSVNGNGTTAHPAGMTQMQPALAEAHCSVNLCFEVEGYGKAQATGRGHTPKEAAANLKATIAETRAAFAPPAPVAPLSREARVAQLLSCGLVKAVAKGDFGRVERLSKSAALVLAGAVHPAGVDGHYTVNSRTREGVWYDVDSAGACRCKDYEHRSTTEPYFFCCHGLAVLMFIRLEETTP